MCGNDEIATGITLMVIWIGFARTRDRYQPGITALYNGTMIV